MHKASEYSRYIRAAPLGDTNFNWSAPPRVAPHMATALDPTWLKLSSLLWTFDIKKYAAVGCLVGTMEAFALQRVGWRPDMIAFFDLDIPEYNPRRDTGSYAYSNVCGTETSNYGGEFIYARTDSVKTNLIERLGPWDCILLDGCHSYEALVSDLELAWRSTAPGGLILVHDLDLPNTGLERAYREFVGKKELTAEEHYSEVRVPEFVHGVGIIVRQAI